MTIIFYDIPSTLPDKAWSPNTWKTRYCLNYKNLPYKTEWIEYPDIGPFCKKHGIKPTMKAADGKDRYTLPAIHDTSTGVYIADSILIAEYLDNAYPTTPAIFPKTTDGIQLAFTDAFFSLVVGTAGGFVLHASGLNLNAYSREWFSHARALDFGAPPEQLVPQGDKAVEMWAKFEENMLKLAGWYEKTDGEGPFMMGGEVSWADIIVAAHLMWMKRIWGAEDAKWKEVVGWQGGRWGRFMDLMDKYAAVA